MAEVEQDRIRQIVEQVVRNLREEGAITPEVAPTAGGMGNGIFEDVDSTINAAEEAQKRLVELDLEKRRDIIAAIRQVSLENAQMLAEMAMEETKMGRLEHKVMKNEGAANLSPGVEDLSPDAVTGSNGLLLIEGAPYGVINSITPITNPTSTVINHAIIMIAAGNAIVYSPHPGAKECTQKTMALINEAIVEAGGPANLQTCLAEPTLRTAKQIMEHPKIQMVVATGGGSVVRAAMSTGKKAIAAGPGNPPVIVDETADIKKAGRDIIAGSSFDNNILCIGEKAVFVLEEVANSLMDELEKNGGQFVNNVELKKIENLLVKDGGMNREYVGKDASDILADAGIRAKQDVLMILAETPADHIFVIEEFLMPILPIVRVKTFDGAVQLAVRTEGGNGHTAIIHSKNIDNITKYAKAIGTTVFVVNAPSYASEGLEGEGFLAMTIAGPTGEGFTRPVHFTRERRTTFA
ncbi:MAG: aldehyde dehydrogenase family protein, partial [Candidatus Poribacteria bacterium]